MLIKLKELLVTHKLGTVPVKAAVLKSDMWKDSVEEATQVPKPAVYITVLLDPGKLSEGVLIPELETPGLPDQTPPTGEAVKATVPALLQSGAIGAITGMGGLKTYTTKIVFAGHVFKLLMVEAVPTV
jgi:hypothetical protein